MIFEPSLKTFNDCLGIYAESLKVNPKPFNRVQFIKLHTNNLPNYKNKPIE